MMIRRLIMNINLYINEEPDNILKDVKDGKKERRIDAFIPIELWEIFDSCRDKLGVTIKALVVRCISAYLYELGYEKARMWL